MICETMIVPLKWQSTQSVEENGSLRFGPIKQVLYIISHFFWIYAAVLLRAREKCITARRWLMLAQSSEAEGRVQILRADVSVAPHRPTLSVCHTGGMMKTVQLTTLYPSFLLSKWRCWFGLSWRSRLCCNKSPYIWVLWNKRGLFLANSTCSSQISWGLFSVSHLLEDPGKQSSYYLE